MKTYAKRVKSGQHQAQTSPLQSEASTGVINSPAAMSERPAYNFQDISILPSQPAVARKEDESSDGVGSYISGAASGAGGLISDVASGIGGVVKSDIAGAKEVANIGGAVADTFANPLLNDVKAIDSGVDWMEQSSAKGNKNMVDQTKDIPILGGLTQGLATAANVTESTIGGTVKGVGDIASGTISGLAHPLDWAGGMEGIAEHNVTIPGLGTALKAGHGALDLAENGGGQYGNSIGDVANHVLNPLQQEKDDAAFDGGLAKGIVAPEGWDKWVDNPIDAMARAATNVGPIIGGIAEGTAGNGFGENGPRGVPPEGVVPDAPTSPARPPGYEISPKAKTGFGNQVPDPTPARPPGYEISPKAKTGFGDPAPGTPEQQPAPKGKNPLNQTGYFDISKLEEWLQGDRNTPPPSLDPQSPNNAKGEWNTPKPNTPGLTPGPDPNVPGDHNPIFDQDAPTNPKNKPIIPGGQTSGDDPLANTERVPATQPTPSLPPSDLSDTIPDKGPWALNPYERIN